MSSSFREKTDEQALWKAIQSGDHSAFRLVYMEYADLLYNYGCKMSPDTALVKDAIQDVFRILWEKKQSIAIKSSLKQYVLTIFRRELLQKLKRQQQRAAMEEPKFELSVESELIAHEAQQELRRALEKAINTLSPRQKEILFLRYYEEMGYEQISVIMSLNPNSMYKLLSAALQRLRKHLA